MNLAFPVNAKLKDGSPVQLVLADRQNVERLPWLYWVIVDGYLRCGLRVFVERGVRVFLMEVGMNTAGETPNRSAS